MVQPLPESASSGASFAHGCSQRSASQALDSLFVPVQRLTFKSTLGACGQRELCAGVLGPVWPSFRPAGSTGAWLVHGNQAGCQIPLSHCRRLSASFPAIPNRLQHLAALRKAPAASVSGGLLRCRRAPWEGGTGHPAAIWERASVFGGAIRREDPKHPRSDRPRRHGPEVRTGQLAWVEHAPLPTFDALSAVH